MKIVIEFRHVIGGSSEWLSRTFASMDERNHQRQYEKKARQERGEPELCDRYVCHEIDIDPDAGFQNCEAFELTDSGEHVAYADIISREKRQPPQYTGPNLA